MTYLTGFDAQSTKSMHFELFELDCEDSGVQRVLLHLHLLPLVHLNVLGVLPSVLAAIKHSLTFFCLFLCFIGHVYVLKWIQLFLGDPINFRWVIFQVCFMDIFSESGQYISEDDY